MLKKLLYIIGLCALALLTYYCGNNKIAVQKTIDYQELKTYASLSDSTHYVGMETCKGCHSDKHSTFIHTGMGLSFDSATVSKTKATFDHNSTIYDAALNLFYNAKLVDDQLFLTEFRLENKDTVHSRTEKVDYIIGSGQHTNSHIMRINGYLYQMPMTFYTQMQKWDLPPGYNNGNNVRFNRMIETECITCHNSYPEQIEGGSNKFAAVPKGISCERCHGPGSAHVAEKAAGKLVNVNEEIDFTIVNPAKLPLNLQISVCQRCHLQGNAVLKPGKSFYDFKPGMLLSDIFTVFVPRFEDDENTFIMASHADRMMRSECFSKSGNMTCITCHNPHESIAVTKKERFIAACNNCHGKTNDMCSLNEKAREKNGNDCISCHMPRSGTSDIPHVTVTDHYIRKVKNNKSAVAKSTSTTTLYAVNEKEPSDLTKAIAYLQQFERVEADIDFLNKASALLASPQNQTITTEVFKGFIHLFFLNHDAQQLINYVESNKLLSNIDDAWTNYRIGEAYFQEGIFDKSKNYLQKAVLRQPLNLDFNQKLAATYYNLSDMVKAKEIYKKILRENPKYAKSYNDLGLIYGQEGNMTMALEYFNKAIFYDPNFIKAYLNKLSVLLNTSKKPEAAQLMLKLQKWFPQNQEVSNAYQQIKSLL